MCAFVVLLTELKELNSSLTTEEMVSEIQELQAECSGYRARLEKTKSATNHVTPEEKEKVGNAFIQQTTAALFFHLLYSVVVLYITNNILIYRFTKSEMYT